MLIEGQNETRHPSYFLISVSNRENLDLCIKYGLAGFLSGENGAWTFCEIQAGDFVSFLYGARVFNLYRVANREAISNAENIGPWEPLKLRETSKPYSFPFRLHLEPARRFSESLIRPEFAYVGENLLLRGGYRKTHFQADQTTLQSVSEMGSRASGAATPLHLPDYTTFALRFTRNRELLNTPEICRFKEPILQTAIRRYLTDVGNLRVFLERLDLGTDLANALEILGEKALPQGHIDLLIKQRVPLGTTLKIPIEVKTKKTQPKDLAQLRAYMDELRGDCPTGILIAADFGKGAVREAANFGFKLVRYTLSSDFKKAATFEEIANGLTLEPIGN
ncbi:MAG: hypothetical protein WCF88_01335 [Candidatus Acidiferrales bacterium]|jgi:hypothetical protein